MTKKKSPIHARDSLSGDSLSFAGLVCIQDVSTVQAQSKIPSGTGGKKETEFEFGHVSHNITAVNPNSNNCPADVLFYKGQLLPQAIQLPQPNQAQVLKQSNLEKDFPTVRNNSKGSANKKEASGGQSFGQKILRFAAPCRDCHATETIPSTKPQALR